VSSLSKALCTLSIAWLLAGSTVCAARDLLAVTEEAKDAVASELAECAAYYIIAAAASADASAPQELRDSATQGALQSANAALEASTKLSNPAMAAARMNLFQQAMIRRVKEPAGFSGVAAQYMFPCKDIVERPDQRFAYWLVEKDKLPEPKK
jgi:hypothetical protein